MNKKSLFALFLALTLTPLFARDIEITVIDADLDLPLEGAVINSWDGSGHICDEEGIAVIPVPEDRRVIVHISYPGYETGRLIITQDTDSYTLGIYLSEIIQSKELIIEASRPGENETRTGRSVAISGQELDASAKIGPIEDTMASVKLLPGVIATEHFDASPSIRGGDPQDLSASLDGYYVTSPFFWGGAFSIFDPRMIESAQLSHGVFSSRHGRTVSGLLDLTTKKPSKEESELEIGTDASAVRVNVSIPLNGKGGILFMGRTTYTIPIVALAQALINKVDIDEEFKDLVNSVNRAPFIRSGTITGNYNLTSNLELSSTVFFGADGTGIKFEHSSRIDSFDSYEKLLFDYTHYQGFLTGALSWNPRYDMLVKFTLGAGFNNHIYEEENLYNIYEKSFSDNFKEKYHVLSDLNPAVFQNYDLKERSFSGNSELIYNTQGRLDYDWDIGKGFLLAIGAQEMLKWQRANVVQDIRTETWLRDLVGKDAVYNSMGIEYDPNNAFMDDYLRISAPAYYNSKITGNTLANTSLYGLAEYISPNGFFGTELGLRADHYCLWGNGDSLGAKPALNPRLNTEFNIIKNRFIFDSVTLTAGTGLFSSMPDVILAIQDLSELNKIKPTRSWTSVIGTNFGFPYSLNLNIEGYFKYIYNRMYSPLNYDLSGNMDLQHYFNGEGRVWGLDIMFLKTRSRYWDGWISYSYNWTQHRDPSLPDTDNEWYFPYYHRFHSLNLVLNIRPVQHINIFTRFGLAGGVQLLKREGSGPDSYPVYIYDSQANSGYFIEKYFWPEVQDKNNRTTPQAQMDMKLSFYKTNKSGKTRIEAYFAVENILSVLYITEGNTVFNPYTGEVSKGRYAASYGLPFPIPSFGFNYYY